MKIKITKKYLVFPVSGYATLKNLRFCEGEKELYKLNIKLDNISPSFYAYVDLSRFIGRELELSVEPEMSISFRETDEMDIDGVYSEPHRPQLHFTTKNGWLNDPNGLVYLNGEYHMFYQYNPCENKWQNMHWGHAVSKDMLHWKEQDVALYPDATGTMYSGSAIIDEKNILGLQQGETKTALLYYTATELFMQYMAYSTDGLKTIKKYGKPVVENLAKSNRDPKVVFCEEWDAYLMALYLEKDMYGLLRSEDLVNWKLVQKIAIANDSECPDIFPMTADDGERMWVLMGASDRYIVGKMQMNSFVPEQESFPLNYSGSAYAGQSFSNLQDGRRIRIDWDRWNISTPRINGQMSIPAELSLVAEGGRYYLCANPIRELDGIAEDIISLDGLELKCDQKERIELKASPYELKLSCGLDGGVIKMTLFGCRYTIDLGAKQLKYGADRSIPLVLTSDRVELRLIVDKCSAELYLDGGKIYSGSVDDRTVCDYDLPYLELVANRDLKLDSLKLCRFGSIWSQE